MGERSFKKKEKEGPPQAHRMIPDEKFRKKEHLLKSGDFRKVYKKGSSVKKDALIFYYMPNGLGHNRLGFSISSGKIKLAVSRNRIRRILREIYRRNKKNFVGGIDMVLIVRKDMAKTFSYRDVENIFLKLAKESGILK